MNILHFWKSNPNYWIAIKNKEEVDKTITELFYDKFPTNWIEQVIFLDQFSRHFQRYLQSEDFNDVVVENWRHDAIDIVILNEDEIPDLDEIELIFVLMPFKHLHYYDYIFHKIHIVWLKGKTIKDYNYLSKFYYDTYKKAYNFEKVYNDVRYDHELQQYTPHDICEYYSLDYINSFGAIKEVSLKLFPKLQYIQDPIVSLSGGVDSMVLLYYYKLIGVNPVAVHIIYGNRKESKDEYNFITEYCKNLKVELFTYSIKWIRRDNVDRDFYETITRDIRFMVYKAVGGKNANIVLGHIRDDVVENIWTNIATCKHIENLKKMEMVDTQKNVNIYRPFFDTTKYTILQISHTIGIPYLKNTTPSWSNRGKYRENFYKAIKDQFGDGVDNNIIRFSEMVSSQIKIVNDLLFNPILNSYDGDKFDITAAIKANIGTSEWEIIFEKIFHKIFGITKPSIHSVKNFYERVQNFILNNETKIKVQLKKDVIAVVQHKYNIFNLKFII